MADPSLSDFTTLLKDKTSFIISPKSILVLLSLRSVKNISSSTLSASTIFLIKNMKRPQVMGIVQYFVQFFMQTQFYGKYLFIERTFNLIA